MKLLGIVILYHPEKDVTFNINSYIHALDELIVWDNTPGGSGINFPDHWNIRKMGVNENVGIGKALNEAVKYAIENNFTHLLTMDQDSRFMDKDCEKYIDAMIKLNKNVISAPNYIINNQALFNKQDALIETDSAMTSGLFYPIEIFRKIGLFRDDYFIDSIDDEFSFRAKKNGIPIFIIPFVHLFHQAGYQRKKHKFLWKTFYPNEYSPIRSYYIIRNGLITRKLYPWGDRKGFLFYYFYNGMDKCRKRKTFVQKSLPTASSGRFGILRSSATGSQTSTGRHGSRIWRRRILLLALLVWKWKKIIGTSV